jgi:hypothetical protein
MSDIETLMLHMKYEEEYLETKFYIDYLDLYDNLKDKIKTHSINSKYQTKKWRKNQDWYFDGKRNECEKKQISIVNQIIGKKIGITNSRLNLDTYNIKQIKRFTIKEYGFEWTEDFDGIIDKNYFNFKFITDSGGAQTRSLRECYLFIKTQLEHLLKYNGDKKFINILDGDTCFRYRKNFQGLLNKEKYRKIRKFVFIGDMVDFELYWLYKYKK